MITIKFYMKPWFFLQRNGTYFPNKPRTKTFHKTYTKTCLWWMSGFMHKPDNSRSTSSFGRKSKEHIPIYILFHYFRLPLLFYGNKLNCFNHNYYYLSVCNRCNTATLPCFKSTQIWFWMFVQLLHTHRVSKLSTNSILIKHTRYTEFWDLKYIWQVLPMQHCIT